MRKFFATFCISVMILILAAAGNAILIEIDLYPGTGDGLLTRSTKTGLDWLDLTVSKGYTYKEIVGGAGNFFASGFRYATYRETQDLFAEFGIPWYDITFRRSTFGPAVKFLRLLGETGDAGKQYRSTHGMTNSFYRGDTPPTSRSPYVQIDTYNNTARGYISRHTAYETGNFGGYLVRSKSYSGPTTVVIGLTEVDLYPGTGDRLLTRSTKTDLDWLDLTVSKGYTYKEIVGGAGNFFASGFRYATYKETQDLFAEFGIPWYDITFRKSTFRAASKFLDLLGETGDAGKQHRSTQGMTNSFYKGDSPPTSHSPYVQIDTSNNTARGYISRHTAYKTGNFGGYLVRSRSYNGPTTVVITIDSDGR